MDATLKGRGILFMNTNHAQIVLMPPSITVRMATLRDIDGIFALKRRITGISIPWGRSELLSQILSFQEGQFVAVNTQNRQIIGALGTLVISRSDYSLLAKWGDLTADGTFRNHDPSHGKTLFRSHLIMDPRFDCKTIRDSLSQAELGIAIKLGLDRIRVGVRFKDYYLFHHLAPSEYFKQVEKGHISDTWITQTLNRGFRALALVTQYYPPDWRSDGYAVVAQLELHTAETKTTPASLPRNFAKFMPPVSVVA